MKKIILLVISVMLLNTVLAADIAYLVKTGPDPYLKAEIISMNISYDTILESNIGSTNLSKYKMILIGDENFDNVCFSFLTAFSIT